MFDKMGCKRTRERFAREKEEALLLTLCGITIDRFIWFCMSLGKKKETRKKP
jgi:hypothetical protein